jgi:hypothetical protein
MPNITPLPTPPSRNDADFADTADTFLSAMPTFGEEVNAVAAAMGVAAYSGTQVCPASTATTLLDLTGLTGRFVVVAWVAGAGADALSARQEFLGTGAAVRQIATGAPGDGTNLALTHVSGVVKATVTGSSPTVTWAAQRVTAA